jgi:hypothetical protein
MEVSETETTVTTEMAVAGSTVVERMAVEEAISRRTTPNRSTLKRFAEMLTQRESRIRQEAKTKS